MKTLTALATSNKGSIEILRSINVEKNIAMATDLDMWITTKIKRAKSGNYSPFGFDKEHLRFWKNDDQAGFPKPDELTQKLGEVVVEIEPLKFVLKAHSKEATRYYLCGIFFSKNIMVATDGHRLNKFEFDKKVKIPDSIIPAKAIEYALKLANEQKKDPGFRGTITIEFYKKVCLMYVGDYKIFAKLIDGTFPDYERVIPPMEFMTGSSFFDPAEIKRIYPEIGIVQKQYGNKHKHLIFSKNKVKMNWKEWETSFAPEITIGFSAPYVLDCTPGMLHYSDSASPVLIINQDNPAYQCVLMPVRI